MSTSTSALNAHAERHVTAARIAITTIFFVNGFTVASWVPHIPTVQARLGLSESVLGLALLGVAGGALLAMPLTGAMVARWGSRRVTVVSSLLLTVAFALPVRSTSLATFVAALVAMGASSGVMDVAMNAHGIAVEKRVGRPVMSSLHALYSVGGLIGAGGSVLALSAGLTPIGHLEVAAALSFLLVVGASRFLLTTATADERGAGPAFVLGRGLLLVFGLLAFVVMMAEGAMADWSAAYLGNTLNARPNLVGAGYAAFSLAMAAGRFTGDRLVAALGPVTLMRAGSVVAASGLGVALLLHHPVAAIIGFGFVGLGLSNLAPVLYSAAGRMQGMSPGAAIAAVTTTGYGGFLAGPPLIGFVADSAGLPIALGLLVPSLVAVAANARLVRTAAVG